ncbi:mannose-1-phosphate guanylyltransferase [Marinilabilia salmonicolor]|jgi:mannose-1-phosphate guanylyltransferase|uniref:mannose-1-phosphate guanylyltransferase n=1 Tax=Marinilabilia salmonicolor TaxID=989 RepID=A0A2T0WJ81_9BACT|nr:sugar phosphate nucleotidyltransferase [Marinilabilia salmonicolor]PRY86768.1 mannose-1-phosphate guanylyltransferase [Marinilabilia salmonicolor]RCW21413.1 mannose-1-phosphate guanylyltransferase [Marinilabilia salmonicolor]
MKTNTFCVIMAGGIGSRFWPLSKTETPKQFLDILGTGKSLLRQTFERFAPICPAENIIVVTSGDYNKMVLEQLPELTPEQVLTEPFRRNTAPCIAFANKWIEERNPDANIVVTPADHLIINESEFHKAINLGLDFVETNDALLTLGIKPHRPETGYGYIQTGKDEANNESIKKVKTFTEKPNAELAKVFFESGEFFWNSGIFLWSLKAINSSFESHLKEVKQLFDPLKTKPAIEEKEITDIYAECKNISIDYGIMEKADNVYVETVNFGWSDLGTWSSLYEYSAQDKEGNAVINGKTLLYDTEGSIVNVPEDKIAVVQGLSDYIVVDSGDALLICPKENEQQIRQFTNDIKTEFGRE